MEYPIFVTRPYLPPKEEYDRLTDEIWNNRWLTNQGAVLQRFEAALADYLEVPQVSTVVNGHMALDIAIKALELTGEVITTPFTFASTTHAIVQNGLTPVFCDIDEHTLTMDVSKIEALITERTSAILAVHVYGHPCDMQAIENIAQKHGLKVIYDAAHAFGVRVDGKSIVTYGDISIFSFHATKLFHSVEGGMLYARDPELLRKCNLLRNYGIENEILVSSPGGNAKMSEFHAAMGLLVLKRIDELIEERRTITQRYRENLKDLPGLLLCDSTAPNASYNYAYMPSRILPEFPVDRDELYESLKESGIYTRRYFYPLTSDFACYENKFANAQVSVAKMVASQILALPIYNGLTSEEVDYICQCIRRSG